MVRHFDTTKFARPVHTICIPGLNTIFFKSIPLHTIFKSCLTDLDTTCPVNPRDQKMLSDKERERADTEPAPV